MIIDKTKESYSKPNTQVGSLRDFSWTDNGLIGHTGSEYLEITVYSPSIIRIRMTREKGFDTFEHTIVGHPELFQFTHEETDDLILISTDLIDLEITKDPLRFVFKTKDGRIINEDDRGLGTAWIGDQVTCYKKLQENERFIGLGEKTGPLDRKGQGYQNWNTDHFGYGPDSDPIYCSIPFYLGIHNDLSYGVFFNNTYKTHFNFGASNNRFSSFSADLGDMDYFFFYNENVGSIIQDYSSITGKMPLPPKWSIGYQQCRYSYYPDKEVMMTAQNFRDKEIPADAIVLDIHYMDAYKIYTWDKERFPDPKKMIDDLKSMGFEVVVMCDPGIKVEKGYTPYEDGVKDDIFIKYPDGGLYEGEVWPGWCHFPDFTDPDARKWWAEQLTAYSDIGVEGYWNDMNEIATWGQMLPELMEFDFDGNKGTTRKARNVYGMMMAKSTFEAGKQNLNGKRPFNLTRAGFSGIQRYAAVWTGDNVASDEHMMLGMRLINSMGISGIPFAGFDVGGFVGNGSENLFARWIALGTFTPFFRGHSMINSRDSEPWTYGETVEEISRNYIKLRYRLMPYIYSAFYTASDTGLPISRSLAIDYTHDDLIYDGKYEHQYMFGDSILVAPVESQKFLTKVYFPKGKWYDLFEDNVVLGGQEHIIECPIERLPVFVKESAIIPLQSQTYSSKDQPEDTLQIHVYKGANPNAFTYYEDDGSTYEYEQKAYYKRSIEYNPSSKELVFKAVEGEYRSGFNKVRVYFHGFTSEELLSAKTGTSEYRFMDPLTNFDPGLNIETADFKIQDIDYMEFDNSNDEVVVKW